MEYNKDTITQKKYYAKSLDDVQSASIRALANLDMRITKDENGYYNLTETSILNIFKLPIKIKIECSERSEGQIEAKIVIKKEGLNMFRNPYKIMKRIFLYIDNYFVTAK